MLLEIDTLSDASEAPGKTKAKSLIFPLLYSKTNNAIEGNIQLYQEILFHFVLSLANREVT